MVMVLCALLPIVYLFRPEELDVTWVLVHHLPDLGLDGLHGIGGLDEQENGLVLPLDPYVPGEGCGERMVSVGGVGRGTAWGKPAPLMTYNTTYMDMLPSVYRNPRVCVLLACSCVLGCACWGSALCCVSVGWVGGHGMDGGSCKPPGPWQHGHGPPSPGAWGCAPLRGRGWGGGGGTCSVTNGWMGWGWVE